MEIDDLARHLQELMRSAGMTVNRLCASFTEEQFRSDSDTPARIPSRATVSRRLNGVGLLGQRPLVEAIITCCTTPETHPAAHRKAMRLFRRASQQATPVDVVSARQDEVTKLRAEVARLRHRLSTRNTQYEALNNRVIELSLLVVEQGRPRERADESSDPRVTAFQQVLQRSEDARRRAERLAESLRQQLDAAKKHAPTTEPVTPAETAPSPAEPATAVEGVEKLVTAIRDLDPTGTRFAAVLREAFDAHLDGLRTGRFRWDQLSRAEKLAIGDRIRLMVSREFSFADGTALDFEIDGVEFDLKFSLTKEWVIRPELLGKPCLLISASDVRSEWSVGLLRITKDLLTSSANQDGKRLLTRQGKEAIRWIHENAPLPPNLLLQLPDNQVEAVLAPRAASARAAELFRRAQGLLIDEAALKTVTMDEHFGRRMREAGVAVRADGVLVLSAQHGQIARQLGLPVPEKRQWVSVRVVPAAEDDVLVAMIDGNPWRPAYPEDPIVEAPRL